MKKILIGLGALAVLIALLMWSGVLKFSGSVGPPPESQKQPQPSPAKTPAKNSEIPWKEYKSDLGYSISYPENWVLKEKTEESREVLIVEPKQLAFVRIVGMYDTKINSPEAIQTSLEDYKKTLKTGSGAKLYAFESDKIGNMAGFSASGEFYVGDTLYRFSERGLLSTNGRVLMMRGAAFMTEVERFGPTLNKIMDSFAAKQ